LGLSELCDVLGWSALETAQLLGGSTASINSALQRARATLGERYPQGRPLQRSRPNPQEALLLERYMQAWQAAATGLLLQKLRTDNDKYLNDMKKAPSTSQATVVDAAITALDADAGTATVVTALDVRQSALVNGVAGAPTVRQLRVKLTLSRTDQGWKVSSSGLVNA